MNEFLFDLLSNSMGGVISGLIIAATIAILVKVRTPLFEVVQVAENRAILKYNGWLPIELGATWDMGKGEILFSPDPKGAIAGDRMAPHSDKVVSFIQITPGESLSIAYRRRWTSEVRGPDEMNYPNATDLVGNKRTKFWGWKFKWVVLSA